MGRPKKSGPSRPRWAPEGGSHPSPPAASRGYHYGTPRGSCGGGGRARFWNLQGVAAGVGGGVAEN